MDSPGPFLLAFFVAVFVSWLDLITTKYRRTFRLIADCPALYFYTAFFGAWSAAVLYALEALKDAKKFDLDGPILSNHPFVVAIALGVMAKALLHIRLWTITVGDKQFPIGIETISVLIEPWLVELIAFHEYQAVRQFVLPYKAHYPNRDVCKTMFLDNVPESADIKQALSIDLDKLGNAQEVMELN